MRPTPATGSAKTLSIGRQQAPPQPWSGRLLDSLVGEPPTFLSGTLFFLLLLLFRYTRYKKRYELRNRRQALPSQPCYITFVAYWEIGSEGFVRFYELTFSLALSPPPRELPVQLFWLAFSFLTSCIYIYISCVDIFFTGRHTHHTTKESHTHTNTKTWQRRRTS